MWRYLFQRLWGNALVYLVLNAIAWLMLAFPSFRIVSFASFTLTTLWFATTISYSVDEERRLSRLGKHAPAVPSYLPLGLDVIFRALYSFSQWRNHEFWYWMFAYNRNDYHPFTVEAVTVGQRIVFTADEENVKAVLATQFADFGKGEQFRKEWKDFLGLSMFPSVFICWI